MALYWNSREKNPLLIYGENNKPIFIHRNEEIPDGALDSDRIEYFTKIGKIISDLPKDVVVEKKLKKLRKKVKNDEDDSTG